MNKPKLGFVFFGLIHTDKCFIKQLKEIKIAKNLLSDIADFELIDCTRTGINHIEFERVELKGYESPNDLETKYDPLAKYRSTGKRKLSGGLKCASIFIQAKDFNDIVRLRPDIDFIFRLRVDLIVNHKLICKAIKNVLKKNTDSPFRVLTHKVWIQFFHLIEPFYLCDTAFLISSRDLKTITDEALNSSKFYMTYALPMSLWGPLFFKINPFLYTLASPFIKETKGTPDLPSNVMNLLPLYWKYISANFYIDYEPNIPHYWQWNLDKGETKSWLKIEKKDVLKLSLNQLLLIYATCNCCHMEENLTYEDIYIITQNKNISLNGIFIFLKLLLNTKIHKLNRILMRLEREARALKIISGILK